eukprot:936741-Rhodomonas_salina.2
MENEEEGITSFGWREPFKLNPLDTIFQPVTSSLHSCCYTHFRPRVALVFPCPPPSHSPSSSPSSMSPSTTSMGEGVRPKKSRAILTVTSGTAQSRTISENHVRKPQNRGVREEKSLCGKAG